MDIIDDTVLIIIDAVGRSETTESICAVFSRISPEVGDEVFVFELRGPYRRRRRSPRRHRSDIPCLWRRDMSRGDAIEKIALVEKPPLATRDEVWVIGCGESIDDVIGFNVFVFTRIEHLRDNILPALI